MTQLTVSDFRELKAQLKVNSVSEVADSSGWSPTTLRRIKKARSLKAYKALCVNS